MEEVFETSKCIQYRCCVHGSLKRSCDVNENVEGISGHLWCCEVMVVSTTRTCNFSDIILCIYTHTKSIRPCGWPSGGSALCFRWISETTLNLHNHLSKHDSKAQPKACINKRAFQPHVSDGFLNGFVSSSCECTVQTKSKWFSNEAELKAKRPG